jgi:hypothetical protein
VFAHAAEPPRFETLPLQTLREQAPLWQQRWTQTVLK